MGCEQARKRKPGERGRWGWAGRKRVAGESTGSVLVPASCPPSAPSIKPSTDISTICNAPTPSNLPKCAHQCWPFSPHSGLCCRPVMDGFSSPHPGFASPQLGKHGQIEGVKPGAVRVTSPPRPRDPVLPGAAGEARDREMERRQEARR